jgi:predicted transcriptional regulator
LKIKRRDNMSPDEYALRLFRVEHVKGILDFIDQRKTTQVKDLEGIADADTLHTSLGELVDLGCITYVGADAESGYEITEKGKKTLQILKEMIQEFMS